MTRETHKFATCLAAISKRRRYFATKGGRIGVGPSDAQPGDLVVMLFYCPTPYLIRQADTVPGQWRFVGEVFISGYMYGEALEIPHLQTASYSQAFMNYTNETSTAWQQAPCIFLPDNAEKLSQAIKLFRQNNTLFAMRGHGQMPIKDL
ncbi:hypothetical protein AC579_5086 [Pseudocercospora musae]|uniref:Uncharacterized protein n=1 Tax=Pseudocercospora musae TaxID=113226 RepID=A0A139INL6_9PEZI|nr:hypothetical protein AC579_5086 [Pseudocercospora musae]